jgi:iron(III) transport system ATP-binding protein
MTLSSYLSIQHVTKTFGSFAALKDITVDIPKGQFTCLLGPSGCGKTTLMRIIAGLEQPDQGCVKVDGRDITRLPAGERNVGIVFQSYALFPNMSASQNIAFALKGKMSKHEIVDTTKQMLELVGLTHLKDRYPVQLSGGQQQRVALARAIALSPSFLLLDEPLSALDAKVRHKLRKELRELQEKLGVTTIMVTHDQEEALTMADQIVVMNDAVIEQIGSPRDVYQAPATPFVADFIGSVNLIPYVDDQVIAIRPEYIQMQPSQVEGSIPAIVQQVEFRGIYSRVYLKLMNQNWSEKEVSVDVSEHDASQLNLTRQAVVHLLMPERRRIYFT